MVHYKSNGWTACELLQRASYGDHEPAGNPAHWQDGILCGPRFFCDLMVELTPKAYVAMAADTRCPSCGAPWDDSLQSGNICFYCESAKDSSIRMYAAGRLLHVHMDQNIPTDRAALIVDGRVTWVELET